eukprot:g1409.t1
MFTIHVDSDAPSSVQKTKSKTFGSATVEEGVSQQEQSTISHGSFPTSTKKKSKTHHPSLNQQQKFGWELVKENSQPLSRGRSVTSLNQHAAQSFASSKTAGKKGLSVAQESANLIERERHQHEMNVKPSIDIYEKLMENRRRGDNDEEQQQANDGDPFASDPLVPWLNYIKWTETKYPTGNNKRSNLMPLLERVTRLFVKYKFQQYRNDKRYLRCWIKYADMLEGQPLDCFRYLYSKGIGEDLALFYIAWAFVAEKADDCKLADDIYQRGIHRRAQPLDQLKQRFRQFQRRMSRKWLNTNQDSTTSSSRHSSSRQSGQSSSSNSSHRSTRDELTRISSTRQPKYHRNFERPLHQGSKMNVGHISQATKAAIGRGRQEAQQKRRESMRERASIGGFRFRDEETEGTYYTGSDRGTSRQSSTRHGEIMNGNRSSHTVNNGPFAVFDEFSSENASAQDDDAATSGGGMWDQYPTQAMKRKENERQAVRWNAEGGIKGVHRMSVHRPFEVFSGLTETETEKSKAKKKKQFNTDRHAKQPNRYDAKPKRQNHAKRKSKRNEKLCSLVRQEKQRKGRDEWSIEEWRAREWIRNREMQKRTARREENQYEEQQRRLQQEQQRAEEKEQRFIQTLQLQHREQVEQAHNHTSSDGNRQEINHDFQLQTVHTPLSDEHSTTFATNNNGGEELEGGLVEVDKENTPPVFWRGGNNQQTNDASAEDAQRSRTRQQLEFNDSTERSPFTELPRSGTRGTDRILTFDLSVDDEDLTNS